MIDEALERDDRIRKWLSWVAHGIAWLVLFGLVFSYTRERASEVLNWFALFPLMVSSVVLWKRPGLADKLGGLLANVLIVMTLWVIWGTPKSALKLAFILIAVLALCLLAGGRELAVEDCAAERAMLARYSNLLVSLGMWGGAT